MDKQYIRLSNGDIIINEKDIMNYPNCKVSNNIIDLLEEGDLVIMEYTPVTPEVSITRLFEVENIIQNGSIISFSNSHINFMIKDGKFIDKESNPIIKSIFTKEKLNSIEFKFENRNDLNIQSTRYSDSEESKQLVKKPKKDGKDNK